MYRKIDIHVGPTLIPAKLETRKVCSCGMKSARRMPMWRSAKLMSLAFRSGAQARTRAGSRGCGRPSPSVPALARDLRASPGSPGFHRRWGRSRGPAARAHPLSRGAFPERSCCLRGCRGDCSFGAAATITAVSPARGQSARQGYRSAGATARATGIGTPSDSPVARTSPASFAASPSANVTGFSFTSR